MFGRPGSGKTLLLSALGEQLVRQGHSVCFAPCAKLVQPLLLAKRELRLPQMLKKLGQVESNMANMQSMRCRLRAEVAWLDITYRALDGTRG